MGRWRQGQEVIYNVFVVCFQELKWLGDTGHSCGGGLDDGCEFVE